MTMENGMHMLRCDQCLGIGIYKLEKLNNLVFIHIRLLRRGWIVANLILVSVLYMQGILPMFLHVYTRPSSIW